MYKRFRDQYLKGKEEKEKQEKKHLANDGNEITEQRSIENQSNQNPEQKEDVTGDKTVAEMDPVILAICQGHMEHDLPNQSKLVRIFTSSTFTDTKCERNALMENVYPQLKLFCQKFGYEFQVVDMRWGVRDEAVDDHRSTELCLKELELCKKLSTGPTFVTFLSHKYGYRPFPRIVAAEEFERILSKLTDQPSLDLLHKWFRKDENCVPTSYVLQPISVHYPDFLNKAEPEKREKAKATFWQESDDIQVILSNAALSFLSGRQLEKYVVSVTEREIQAGLLDDEKARERCLWFKRTISDIQDQEHTRMVSRFYECKGSNESVVEEARKLLKMLKEKKIPGALPRENILEYNVKWHPDGIAPDKVPEHLAYVKRMCSDFQSRISSQIQKAIEVRERLIVQDPLYLEISQHLEFCKEKCTHFYGRREIIETIRNYVLDEKANQPLILHGASGCGKTSIMAEAAKEAWKWTGGDACIVLRFLGTTQDSSTIESLLLSISQQIFRYLSKKTAAIPKVFKELSEFVSELLPRLIRKTRPVVLFLDSIDQLEVDNGARQCQWLPVNLSPGLRVVVSTLPERKYGVMPNLRYLVTNESNFVQVTDLSMDSVSDILSSWLAGANRRLTKDQFNVVVSAFKQCPLPLYLRLCFDESCRWSSYHQIELSALRETVPKMINLLFQNIERDHGKVLTSRALGYLTLARSGLSEGELEDILSLDETVLNDTYQFWVPPLRRLPPLLLARVRQDLMGYLVERGADRTRVLVWYHRQFIEAAKLRYCSDETTNREMHSILGDYFRGVWSSDYHMTMPIPAEPKPFVDRHGKEGTALRYVSSQPVTFHVGQHNLRKLMELPHHLLRSGNADLLKKECICSFEFLIAKIDAKGVSSILYDVLAAKSMFPDDAEVSLILQVLQLSQGALQYEKSTLTGQLLGRIVPNEGLGENIQNLLKVCRAPPLRSIVANKPILSLPGGQLVHVLKSHKKDISAMSVSQSGKHAVTGSEDRSVKIWDIKQAILIRTIDKVGKDIEDVQFIRGDEYVIAVHKKGYTVINVENGAMEKEIPSENGTDIMKCIVLDDSERFIGPANERMHVYNAHTWERDFVICKEEDHRTEENELNYYNSFSVTTARNNFVVICPLMDDHYIDIFDLKEKKFVKRHLCYPLPKSDDDDDYEVSAMVLSPDETKLYMSSNVNNLITINAFPSMETLRSIETNDKGSLEKYSLSPDERYLYGMASGSVMILDLETEKIIYTCKHSSYLVGSGILSRNDIVTATGDNDLRIWDLSREPMKLLWDAVRDVEHSWRDGFYTLGSDNRYLVGIVVVTMKTEEAKSKDKRHVAVVVYDLRNRKTVSKTKFYLDETKYLKGRKIDESRMLLECSRQLYVFDLKTQQITHKFIGFIGKYVYDIEVNLNVNEVWTFTRGVRRLKCYDLSTGKVKKIRDVPGRKADKPLESMKLMPNGKHLLVTDEDCDCVYLMDIETDEQVTTIRYNKNTSFTPSEIQPALDGTVLIIPVESRVGKETISIIAIFNIETKQFTHILFDKLSYYRHIAMKKSGVIPRDEDHNMDVYTHCVLDDKYVVTGSMDSIVRVWNTQTGQLVRYFMGHTQDVTEVFVPKNSTGRVLTTSTTEGENAFRVWDLAEPKCVATFKMDVFPSKVHVINNCDVIIGLYKSSFDPCLFYQVDDKGFLGRWSGSPIDWLENSRDHEDRRRSQQLKLSATPIGEVYTTYPENTSGRFFASV